MRRAARQLSQLSLPTLPVVMRRHAAALVELEAAYDSKMCVMEKALKEARCCTAEVVTVTAAAEAVLGPGSSAITRVHVSQSVAASLAAVDEIQPPDIQSVVYVDGGAPLVAGSVGRIVSGLDDLGKSKGNLRDGGGEDGVVVKSESDSDSDDGVAQVCDVCPICLPLCFCGHTRASLSYYLVHLEISLQKL